MVNRQETCLKHSDTHVLRNWENRGGVYGHKVWDNKLKLLGWIHEWNVKNHHKYYLVDKMNKIQDKQAQPRVGS